jgi:hypothetical protein
MHRVAVYAVALVVSCGLAWLLLALITYIALAPVRAVAHLIGA